MRHIDLASEKSRIIDFIREYLSLSGFGKVIIGISGGLDSAAVASLAVEALGQENVSGVMMPYKKSNPDSLSDGLSLAKAIDIKHRIIDITPMVDAWFENYEPEANTLRRGNYMARIRMTVLYDLAAKEDSLVIGTGNKSELLSGYTTQYGDNACAFEPIGHLYKTEVRLLAKELPIPDSIISKQPSADLWEGQTDEAELGVSYAELDKILYHLYETMQSREELSFKGFSHEKISRVIDLYRKSAFKRKMPPCLEEI